MLKGDLSNRPAPRLVFVWEGVLAHARKEDQKAIDRHLKRRRYRKALEMFDTDSVMSHQLWRLAWNYDFGIDVVTYLIYDLSDAPALVEALKERLDREDLPVGHVMAEDPYLYSRSMPIHVERVFDNDEKRILLYGSRGRQIQDPRVFEPLY